MKKTALFMQQITLKQQEDNAVVVNDIPKPARHQPRISRGIDTVRKKTF